MSGHYQYQQALIRNASHKVCAQDEYECICICPDCSLPAFRCRRLHCRHYYIHHLC